MLPAISDYGGVASVVTTGVKRAERSNKINTDSQDVRWSSQVSNKGGVREVKSEDLIRELRF